MLKDCVKDGEWGLIGLVVITCIASLLMMVWGYTLIFVEEEHLLIPRCSPVPYYVQRDTKDWIYKDIGTIRMTPEEAVQECGK